MKIAFVLAQQTGQNNPILISLAGNLAINPTFQRDTNGQFRCISAGSFPIEKTFVIPNNSISNGIVLGFDQESFLPDEIAFTNCVDGVPTDGIGQFSFLICVDDEQPTFTAEQLTAIFQAKSTLASIGYTFENSDLKTL